MFLRIPRALGVIFLIFWMSWGVLSARSWTLLDRQGTTIEAELVSFKNGTVILKKDAGGKVLYQIDAFSEADRAYILQRFPDGEAVKRKSRTTYGKARLAEDGFIDFEPELNRETGQKKAQAETPTATGLAPLPHLRGLRLGAPAPKLEVYPQGSPDPIPLNNYRGQLVLVIFWSPRDAASMDSMPYLVDIYTRYADKGIEFVGIGMEQSRPTLNQTEKQLGITFPARQDRAQQIAGSWGVTYLPTMVLIDQNGIVVRDNLRLVEVEPEIRKYLGLDR